MSIQELIHAASAMAISDDEALAIKTQVSDAEFEFESDSRLKAVDDTFLSRTYSL